MAKAQAQTPRPPFNPADFDTTCAPCRDFDQFANGGWRTRTKLPPGYSSYTSFEEVHDRNEAVLRGVLERAAADKQAKPGTDLAKLGTYYSTCMDSAGAEAAGAKPIAGLLADIDGMKSTKELAARTAWLHAHGIGGVFGFISRQDPGNSDDVIAFASQGGWDSPTATSTRAPTPPRWRPAPPTCARAASCSSWWARARPTRRSTPTR